MSDSINNPKLNRRSMLLGAVFLVGGAAALTRFTRAQPPANPDGPTLSSSQYALLEQVSEIMIPASDTPGAIAVGVPDFVREMYAHWACVETRAQIASVLDAIEKLAWAQFGAAFLELPGQKRLEVIRVLDEQRIGANDAAYCLFKRLVLLGYYNSEVGATQELRFELVPGAWRPCMPLSEVGRSSAV